MIRHNVGDNDFDNKNNKIINCIHNDNYHYYSSNSFNNYYCHYNSNNLIVLIIKIIITNIVSSLTHTIGGSNLLGRSKFL